MKNYNQTKYLVLENGQVFNSITNKQLKPQLTKNGYLRMHRVEATNVYLKRYTILIFIRISMNSYAVKKLVFSLNFPQGTVK